MTVLGKLQTYAKGKALQKPALKMAGRIWFSIIGVVASMCLSKASLRSANYRKSNSGTWKGSTFAGSFFASVSLDKQRNGGPSRRGAI